MIPQSIKDRIDEYRVAIFDSSTPSHARKRLEDAIEEELTKLEDRALSAEMDLRDVS